MKEIDTNDLSWDDRDEPQRPVPQKTGFNDLVEAAISLCGFLNGVLAFGSAAAVMGAGLLSGTSVQPQATSRFGFTPHSDPDGWHCACSRRLYLDVGHTMG